MNPSPSKVKNVNTHRDTLTLELTDGRIQNVLGHDLLIRNQRLLKRTVLYGFTLGLSLLALCQAGQAQNRRGSSSTATKSVDNVALFYAAKENDVEKARGLLAAGANLNARAGVVGSQINPFANLTPLHVAAEFDSKDVARLLMDRGADLKAKNLGGETPLHIAAKGRDTSMAMLLLDHGADPNAADVDGNTPLMNAVGASRLGDTGMVELLVSRGANVNARNRDRETPLFIATEFASGDESAVVSYLLAHGADANAQTNRGETSLSLATKRKNSTVAELLRANGAKLSDVPSYADLEDAADTGNVAKLQELLAKLPDRRLVNWRNENGAGLLWGAAAQNRPEVVRVLLENGAGPNLATTRGETPLHEAASHSATASAAEQVKAVEIATMLLENGADVNAKTTDGITPLKYAQVNHQDRMVDLLKQHGGHE
jgi:ankyrin repeat protein